MKLADLFVSAPVADHSRPVWPMVIAEAGVNHEGRMDLARRLIDEAREGGAEAIKFQTYRAGTLASRYSPSYWDTTLEPTTSQYELFRKYDRFWKEEFEALKRHCDGVGIEFLSTPFDVESARFLNDLMGVFKISSSDLTNRPFIELICGFGKPILLSVGAANLDEIERAVSWIDARGNPLALLHCVLNYPTEDANANLGMIADLRERFPGKVIGYSDHTLPGEMRSLEVATLLGARVLEKHFTFDKSLPGNDHYHAMDREDLKRFKANLRQIFSLLGSFEKRSLASEEPARRNARRSLVATRDIAVGELLTAAMVTWKRPAHGISPADWDEVIGRRTCRPLAEDTPIQWDDLEGGRGQV
ncbi:MAG: N-acetylneuraminate synthase family protein [Magnetococcales bacterium]|nr:N-acetylneuraminate synthase family protein [Magnetococcales bacterium]MBF0156124.1 N-acetylneuraminate synthase family protein [Magnetococcales bacterium]